MTETGRDTILAHVESDHYSQGHLNDLIEKCISDGLKAVDGETKMLKYWTPEISVVLTSVYDEDVRPSLHLNISTIQHIADIGASFDFDPYV